MRVVGIVAAALAALIASSGRADAAGWCAANDCGFSSRQRCVQATGDAAACRRAAAPRLRRSATVRRAPSGPPARASIYGWPARPHGASPAECLIDNGYGRFSSCEVGGGHP